MGSKTFLTKVEDQKSKSNFYYTRGIKPKRVTSGEILLRGLSAWATQLRRNVTAVASRWQHCPDLIDSCTDIVCSK